MILETNRLIIRPWKQEDLPLLSVMARDVGYNCFTIPGTYAIQDETEARKKLAQRMTLFQEHKIGKWPVFLKTSGEFIGTCGGDFFKTSEAQGVELGYRYLLSHWGKGYASEAALRMSDYLLKEAGLEELYAFAIYQNPASLNIIEKTGFIYQRDFMWADIVHRLYLKRQLQE